MKRTTPIIPLGVAIASILAVAPAAAQVPDTTDHRPVELRTELPGGERMSYRESKLREARERTAAQPVIGVVLAQDATTGVAIAAVTPGSAASQAGLRTGDRLLAIDGHAVLGSTGALRTGSVSHAKDWPSCMCSSPVHS